MYLRPKRCDFGNVHLLKDHPSQNADRYNYIIFRSKEPVLVLHKYKTAHIYGEIVEKIPRELYEIIRASLKSFPRKHLFISSRGEPYKKNKSFSEFVRNVFDDLFGKKMGMSMWRHIYVNSQINFNDMSQERLETEARLMGHSVNQQMLAYKFKKSI